MKNTSLIIMLLLSSAVFAFNFASPNDPSAKLVMNHPQVTQQIFPMRLLTVNGQNVSSISDAAWFEPGEYELRFAALVDNNYTKTSVNARNRRSLEPENMTLNLKVEADKSYYVGFDTSSADVEKWKAVVFKVE